MCIRDRSIVQLSRNAGRGIGRRKKARCDFLAAIRPGATPVPIPNTMVKTQAADGTALETVWESNGQFINVPEVTQHQGNVDLNGQMDQDPLPYIADQRACDVYHAEH